MTLTEAEPQQNGSLAVLVSCPGSLVEVGRGMTTTCAPDVPSRSPYAHVNTVLMLLRLQSRRKLIIRGLDLNGGWKH